MKDGKFDRRVLDTDSFESDGIQFTLDIVLVSCKSFNSIISTILIDLKSDFITASFPMYYNDNVVCFEVMRGIINCIPKKEKKEFKQLLLESLKESYINKINCQTVC